MLTSHHLLFAQTRDSQIRQQEDRWVPGTFTLKAQLQAHQTASVDTPLLLSDPPQANVVRYDRLRARLEESDHDQ